MPSTRKLENKIRALEEKIAKLEKQVQKTKEWSDLNDYWIEEKLNSLTKCVDKLMGIYEEDEIDYGVDDTNISNC